MTDSNVGEPPRDHTGRGDGAVRRRCDGVCTPSVAVVEAVAAATGRDPTELPLLDRTIDTDGLDALFDEKRDDPDRSAFLSFDYGGAEVIVGDDGEVVARPRGDGR